MSVGYLIGWKCRRTGEGIKCEGLKFLVPVKLSWTYEENIRESSSNALVDSGAEATIFDTDFVE